MLIKQAIYSSSAPKVIGTYSQAIQSHGLVFLSGQIPLDPKSNEMISGNLEARVHQVFKNLRAVAEASGGDVIRIVKLTIYLTDLQNFSMVNSVMSEYFDEPYPARAAIGVATLPKEADVEAEGILAL